MVQQYAEQTQRRYAEEYALSIHTQILALFFSASALAYSAFLQLPSPAGMSGFTMLVRDIGVPAAFALIMLYGAYFLGKRLLAMAEVIASRFLADLTDHIKDTDDKLVEMVSELKKIVMDNTIMMSRVEGTLRDVQEVIRNCKR